MKSAPWDIIELDGNSIGIIGHVAGPETPDNLRKHYNHIATVTQRDPHPHYDGGISRATCRAHARLMSAAPELLEALKVLHARYVQCIGNEGPEALAARAAIAKATKETA